MDFESELVKLLFINFWALSQVFYLIDFSFLKLLYSTMPWLQYILDTTVMH